MEDFNNFFDNNNNNGGGNRQQTPIYHTPDPKPHKNNTAQIICIIMAVVMCLAIIINVIVLAGIKDKVAKDYADELAAEMREQYSQAIKDALDDTSIVEDVTDAAKDEVIANLGGGVGLVANNLAPSVARLYMYKSDGSLTSPNGIATGFLISDTNANGTKERYLVTNAHCVRYVQATQVNNGFPFLGSGSMKYEWRSYEKILCIFDGEDKYYELEIVAYGSYQDEFLGAENNQADLAVLKIVGDQPTNEDHPSFKIASSSYEISRGMEVALIGNPENVGITNSISTGTISQTGISISSWGSGEFVLTDAAVNGGNSGGPMIDVSGTVVGVVESKLVSEDIDNMGFALSAETLRNFLSWAESTKGIQIDYILK